MINGTVILLAVRTGTGPDVYTDVGGQRGISFDENVDEIDISNKIDGADFKMLPGRRKQTFQLDASYLRSETAFTTLQSAIRAGTKIRIRRSDAGSDIEQADGYLTSISENHPDQDNSVVSIAGTIDGPWGAIV